MINKTRRLHKLLAMVKYIYIAGSLCLAVFFGTCAYWYWGDRDEPFELLTYVATPARHGGRFHIAAKVRRDLDRECSVDYARAMYDVNGNRFYESPLTHMSASTLTKMNETMKGNLYLSLAVPENAPIGPVVIQTSLSYRCNPMHVLKPIEMTMTVETEVIE